MRHLRVLAAALVAAAVCFLSAPTGAMALHSMDGWYSKTPAQCFEEEFKSVIIEFDGPMFGRAGRFDAYDYPNGPVAGRVELSRSNPCLAVYLDNHGRKWEKRRPLDAERFADTYWVCIEGTDPGGMEHRYDSWKPRYLLMEHADLVLLVLWAAGTPLAIWAARRWEGGDR